MCFAFDTGRNAQRPHPDADGSSLRRTRRARGTVLLHQATVYQIGFSMLHGPCQAGRTAGTLVQAHTSSAGCEHKRDLESKTSDGQRKDASGLPVYEKQRN